LRIGPGDSHQPRLAIGGLSKERKAMFSATLMRGTAAFFSGSSGRPNTLKRSKSRASARTACRG
jgi:hypothetical protein